MADFNWLHDAWTSKKKLNHHAIDTNRFDREDLDRMLREVPQFARAREELGDFTATGIEAATDAFMALYKGLPTRRDISEMEPEFFVNHRVSAELAKLPEFDRLRRFSVGDDVQAALAVEQMESELETLFDRTQKEQQKAQELQQMLDELMQALQDQRDVNQAIKQWEEQNPPQEPQEPQESMADVDGRPRSEAQVPQELSNQQQSLEDQIKDLESRIQEVLGQLEEDLDRVGSEARQALRGAVNRAANDAEELFSAAAAWGMEPGELHRLSADERLRLAKRLNNPHFRRIADLFGPMKNLMFTEQTRKVEYANDEVFDVTLGNNLSHLLPKELLALDQNEDEFLLRFSEGKLMQYDLQGEEHLARGGIILCEDGSGSMRGERQRWSKAVMLCLLHLARQQKRPFHLIHFSTVGQAFHLSFEKPHDYTMEQILDAAELFYGGGTHFETPMRMALDILREQNSRNGAVEADVVFVTDDEAYVDPGFMEEYLAEADRLQFTTYGFAITHYPPEENGALAQMTKKKVFHINDLLSGEEIRNFFRAL